MFLLFMTFPTVVYAVCLKIRMLQQFSFLKKSLAAALYLFILFFSLHHLKRKAEK